MNSTAPHTTQPSTADTRPTRGEVLDQILEIVGFVFVAVPPVVFIGAPWLILVLLLIPPAALVLTLVAVVVVAGALIAAVGAIVASPYLLVRHLQARHAGAQLSVSKPAPQLIPIATRRSAA